MDQSGASPQQLVPSRGTRCAAGRPWHVTEAHVQVKPGRCISFGRPGWVTWKGTSRSLREDSVCGRSRTCQQNRGSAPHQAARAGPPRGARRAASGRAGHVDVAEAPPARSTRTRRGRGGGRKGGEDAEEELHLPPLRVPHALRQRRRRRISGPGRPDAQTVTGPLEGVESSAKNEGEEQARRTRHPAPPPRPPSSTMILQLPHLCAPSFHFFPMLAQMQTSPCAGLGS